MYRRIAIPFLLRFETPMLEGSKTCTTRYKRLGMPGDYFAAFGRTFVLDKVEPCYLFQVANKRYREEGFDTRAEFVCFWKAVYPRKGFQPNARVWLHRFFREL